MPDTVKALMRLSDIYICSGGPGFSLSLTKPSQLPILKCWASHIDQAVISNVGSNSLQGFSQTENEVENETISPARRCLPHKPGDLSPTPRTHIKVERINWLGEINPSSPYTGCGVHALPFPHPHHAYTTKDCFKMYVLQERVLLVEEAISRNFIKPPQKPVKEPCLWRPCL